MSLRSGKGYSLPEPIQLLNEELIGSQIEHGKVAVLPVIDSPTSIFWIAWASYSRVMPA
jgi:hypothetical protein